MIAVNGELYRYMRVFKVRVLVRFACNELCAFSAEDFVKLDGLVGERNVRSRTDGAQISQAPSPSAL
jgi:hypothetical protein